MMEEGGLIDVLQTDRVECIGFEASRGPALPEALCLLCISCTMLWNHTAAMKKKKKHYHDGTSALLTSKH